MENSWAGPAAVVLFVGWLAYFVPTRLAMRQQVVDGHVDDRFSGNLRVLAVASDSAGTRMTRSADGSGAAGGSRRSRPVHTPASGVPLLSGARPATGSLPVVRAHGGDGARLRRRAAAARRRLVLALALLVVCLGVVVAAACGALPWPVLLLPALLLGGVIALGRRTVVAQRRADAARIEAARARVAAVRRTALGGPVAPRNAARPRITGLAVPSSQTATQMIPRVPAPPGFATESSRVPASSGAAEASRPAGVDRRAPEAVSGAVPAKAARAPRVRADEVERSTVRMPVPPPSSAPSSEPTRSAPRDVSPSTGAPWAPVPVPPPTYTLKPRAGRAEPRSRSVLPEPLPAPVPVEELAGMQAPGTVSVGRVEQDGSRSTVDDSALPGVPEATGEAPSTDTLGLSLGAILARRRVVGE